MIKVLFFGSIVDKLGRREYSLAVNEGMTLAEVVRAVGCDVLTPVLVAVNQEQVNNMHMPVKSGDEVALMPPFSGG